MIRQGPSRQIFAEQKQADPTADVQPFETQNDHLVYQLYNLTPEEIALVEGK